MARQAERRADPLGGLLLGMTRRAGVEEAGPPLPQPENEPMRPSQEPQMNSTSISEYARYWMGCGIPIHYSEGVFWKRLAPFYFKPLWEFDSFPRGSSRPALRSGGVTYSHQVLERRDASRLVHFLVLDQEGLERFSLETLRPEKRNQVRKGLRCCEVREISDVADILGDLRLIAISQAERLAPHANQGHGPAYYEHRRAQWEASILENFRAPGHTWWGAFSEGRLVAYAMTIAVNDVLMLTAAKSHSAFLHLNPNDAIYFRFLSAAAEVHRFRCVANGGPMRASLDRFKEGFGFVPTAIPYFTRDFGIAGAARWLTGHRR